MSEQGVTAMAESNNTMIASRNGLACTSCQAATHEPLWMVTASRYQGNRPQAVCLACRDKWRGSWHRGETWLDPQPCVACGLLVGRLR